MKFFNLFKKSEEKKRSDEYENGMATAYHYAGYFSPELTHWIANEKDPVLLSSAYCLINCWDWPTYLPKPSGDFDCQNHGWFNKNYNEIKFTQVLMAALKDKAEMLSPGITQIIWMSKQYRAYSSKELPTVQASVATDDDSSTVAG